MMTDAAHGDESIQSLSELRTDSSPPMKESTIGNTLGYDDESYKMNHKSRGIALIINVMYFDDDPKGTKNRHGSLEDVKQLTEVLKEDLKFTVIVSDKTDLNSILNDLKLVAKMDHSANDCLMVIVMSHGEENGRILTSDRYFDMKEVSSYFSGDRCETLIGKPRLFFVQACRGETLGKGVRFAGCSTDSGEYAESFLIPSTADQLTMYATDEGCAAMRSHEKGSWLVEELCRHLKGNKTDDLVSVLTTVTRKVALRTARGRKGSKEIVVKQSPVIVSSLTKKIYFYENQSVEKLYLEPMVLTDAGQFEVDDEAFKHMSDTAKSFYEAAESMKNAAESFAKSLKRVQTTMSEDNGTASKVAKFN